MNIGDAIYNILSNDTGISNLVSNRIYPNQIAQDVSFPVIRFNEISNDPSDDKDGVSKLDQIRIQVDSFGANSKSAHDVADAVRSALDRTSGTFNSVIIQSIQFLDQNTNFDETGQVTQVSQDYKVRHRMT